MERYSTEWGSSNAMIKMFYKINMVQRVQRFMEELVRIIIIMAVLRSIEELRSSRKGSSEHQLLFFLIQGLSVPIPRGIR